MSKASASSHKEIVLDVRTLLIPGAIILAGLMISVSVFLGLRRLDATDVLAQEASEETVAGQQAAGQPSAQEPSAPNEATTSNIDDDPFFGDKNTATVAIVEFTDFECPYCKRHHNDTYPQIIQIYVYTGKAIYGVRDYPLAFHDPAATEDALAAECVQDLKGNVAYFEFIDKVFNKSAGNGGGLADGAFETIAQELGVDKGQLNSCIETKKFQDEIKADADAGSSAGISGTPGFVVGKLSGDGTVDGVLVAGAYPYSTFSDIIEGLL